MLLWRLVPERWADTAFTGEGARLYGGRWNSAGTPLVYLSSALSLAALEVLVHADVEDLPSRFAACSVEVPAAVAGAIETVDPETLSKDWRAVSAPPELRAFGNAWVREARSALLAMPSVIIPEEQNFLLNPAHADFKKLEVRPSRAFFFDPRLYAAD
ncbi:RES domain-containing protein [Aggregicoccus sp. 17bor-14]|uniref:RES family NAD+ phosphorylase n=1 Tax=Myxococcaceae TaxID=31 RepID=UPI00129C4994|nr:MULTISPECIES: RES domain-containing protein [Myxococcaceae]MBF5043285.1 RES domain-containing protein [Simulacricoccus sp. 17bor-14]MRI89043.1 RES domain-containing protein [Aggregicoccus sp. 17bor-14]